MNIHNRWFQLGAALVGMIMIANFQYAWTLFVKPIQQSTGWNLSDVQWAFTLFILFQTWVQPCQVWLIDRMGPRWFVSVAGVLCGIGPRCRRSTRCTPRPAWARRSCTAAPSDWR